MLSPFYASYFDSASYGYIAQRRLPSPWAPATRATRCRRTVDSENRPRPIPRSRPASLIWNDRLSSACGSCGKRLCRFPSRCGRAFQRPQRRQAFPQTTAARATKVTDDIGRFDDESR